MLKIDILNTFTQNMKMDFEALKPKVSHIVSDHSQSIDQRLLAICELLEGHISHYDWVGFYFVNSFIIVFSSFHSGRTHLFLLTLNNIVYSIYLFIR